MQRLTSRNATPHSKLRLATGDGRYFEGLDIAPIDAPEAPLVIRFEGLSPEQQRAVLAAFPGGKRFVLAG